MNPPSATAAAVVRALSGQYSAACASMPASSVCVSVVFAPESVRATTGPMLSSVPSLGKKGWLVVLWAKRASKMRPERRWKSARSYAVYEIVSVRFGEREMPMTAPGSNFCLLPEISMRSAVSVAKARSPRRP